jgi:hypothetical protein
MKMNKGSYCQFFSFDLEHCKKPDFFKEPGFYIVDRPQPNLQLFQGSSAT